MRPRVEFMYNMDDFTHERGRMRNKFVKEIHRKTSLEDIGRTLDKFVLDSKAKMDPRFYRDDVHTLE
jgi:hypothetical protein